MRFADAIAELERRQPESMPKPSLDRIRAIAELLDDPQRTYPTIHVTGTNGKTTAARVVAALACAHGFTAGLYTSPHLLSVRERMAICGADVTEHEFGEEYGHLLPILQVVDARAGPVTYFEALTALAFLWFADKPVDLGVFEVGMGGTWDATNLVTGDVALLCPIGLDHPELGSTVAEVTTEKAGIVKAGKIAVSREQHPEALRVIEARCAEVGAELRLELRDFEVEERRVAMGGQSFRVRGLASTYDDLFVPLFGEYAARNAAAAIAAAESIVGRALDEDATREALAGVTSPGRLEVVGRSPLVVLDGAHNAAAAESLAGALREFFSWNMLHLVVAGFTNHDLGTVIGTLAPLADRAYAAANASPRSRPAEDVARFLVEQELATQTFPSVAAALAAAREGAAGNDLILVTGSLYTVADALRALGGT